MPYIYDQLLKANLEVSASDLTPVSTGLIYFNSSSAVIKIYNGSGWKTVTDTDTSQTLINKNLASATNTLTGATATSFTGSGSSTITLPTASSTLATLALSEILINKAIDADANTITNIENADIKAGAAIARNKLASGTASHVVINDGSGVMSSEATLSKARGGSGQDNSSLTFPASGTLATLAGTEALTNKDLSDSTNDITGATATSLTNGGTINIPSGAGTFATIAGTQVLTNKDIDGGTASNTSRITLPKDTTANLDALTDKQGTVAYDTTLGAVVFNNGSAWAQLASAGTATPSSQGTVTSYTPVAKSSDTIVVDADITITDTDGYGTIFMDTGAVARTVTLPTAADNDGRELTIVKMNSDSGRVLVDGEGAETIEGQTGINLYLAYESITIRCNGTGWFITSARWAVGEYGPTPTGVTNITGTPAFNRASYKRITHDIVEVVFNIDHVPTASGNTVIRFDPPIASNFDSSDDAWGVATWVGDPGSAGAETSGGFIYADAVNDALVMKGYAHSAGGSRTLSGVAIYKIQ